MTLTLFLILYIVLFKDFFIYRLLMFRITILKVYVIRI